MLHGRGWPRRCLSVSVFFVALAGQIAEGHANEEATAAPQKKTEASAEATPAGAKRPRLRRAITIVLPQVLAVALGTGIVLSPGEVGPKWGGMGATLCAGTGASALVHWSYGEPEKGFVGLGLRIGTGFGGFIVANNLACGEGCSNRESLHASFAGLAVGTLVGAAVDAAMLSYDGALAWHKKGQTGGFALSIQGRGLMLKGTF